VPKASIDKNRDMLGWDDKIGLSRQAFWVNLPADVSLLEQKGDKSAFGRAILRRPDRSHIFAAARIWPSKCG